MLSLQQIVAAGEVQRTIYQAGHKVSAMEVEMIDTTLRAVVTISSMAQGLPRNPVRWASPEGVPAPIQANSLTMAPAWMMRLAWVPSSPSAIASKR